MKRSVALLASILLPQLPTAPGLAQNLDDSEPVRCISLSRIDHTEVIDGQTVAFFMRGNDVYLNHLTSTCFRLEREGRFGYRSSTGRICSADTIVVLENTGFGLGSGASCGLGLFVPTTEEHVETLKGTEPAEVTVETIEVEQPDSTVESVDAAAEDSN